jgi:hypothetical protein
MVSHRCPDQNPRRKIPSLVNIRIGQSVEKLVANVSAQAKTICNNEKMKLQHLISGTVTAPRIKAILA